jgi:hypothetical protein
VLFNLRLAFLADAVRATIIALDTDTSRLVTLRANQHYIRNRKRGFEFNTARIDRAALGLHLALMLGMNINTRHHQAACDWQDLDHLATLALIFQLSADYLNGIALTDLDVHRSLLN